MYVCSVEVDLSDESGNVKNLAEIPDRYATELVRDRQRLVLIRVDREWGNGGGGGGGGGGVGAMRYPTVKTFRSAPFRFAMCYCRYLHVPSLHGLHESI